MCGIAGIINLDRGAVDTGKLKAMADTLSHRGPDDQGFYLFGAGGGKLFPDLPDKSDMSDIPGKLPWLGFAHRRLSIIDLAEGSQPMESSDEKLCVVFNGEIYNYIELKTELQSAGCEFRTNSDTEVLLQSYKKWGIKCLDRFNGMFAFAILDLNANELFLARDRIGKKPLYYSANSSTFVFASELPSILKFVDVSENDVNSHQIRTYLKYQYIPSPDTIYKNIFKLPAGHYLRISLKTGAREIKDYWNFVPQIENLSFGEACDKLQQLLNDAVKIRLRSDVPYAAFLSGGIDSAIVAKFIRENTGASFTGYTIGFAEGEFDESQSAGETAKTLGINHEIRRIGTDFFTDIEEIIGHFGEPFADSSCLPTYAVCKTVAEKYKVALSGDGGDEIFAGYNTYDYIRRGLNGTPESKILNTLDRNLLSKLFSQLKVWLLKDFRVLHSLSMSMWTEFDVDEILSPEIAKKSKIFELDSYLDSSYDWLTSCQYCDLKTYLHDDILTKVDRMSMMNSLELRSPLLDYRIIEFAFSLPSEFKYAHEDGTWNRKRIIKQIAKDYLGDDILKRPKQGFGFPIYRLMTGEKCIFEKLLTDYSEITSKYFNVASVKQLLAGKENMSNASKLWYLYCFAVWHAKFVGKKAFKNFG